jgi:flavin-dependent dehydrogenase
MINPLSGEGIDYAMESGRFAAHTVVRALARPTPEERERTLQSYPHLVRSAYGSYFTVGRLVTQALGHPRIMRLVATHSLQRPAVRRLMFALWANLTDPHGKDAVDRLVRGVLRVVPPA